jgi:hypothetical protein
MRNSLRVHKSRVMAIGHEVCTILNAGTHHPVFPTKMSVGYVKVPELRSAGLHAPPDFFPAQSLTPLTYIPGSVSDHRHAERSKEKKKTALQGRDTHLGGVPANRHATHFESKKVSLFQPQLEHPCLLLLIVLFRQPRRAWQRGSKTGLIDNCSTL